MLPDMVFRAARQTIEAGETMLIFTDGVTDARNAQAVAFSDERLLAMLGHAAEAAEMMVARVQAAVAAHAVAADRFDDMTMLAVHRAAAA